MGESRRTSRARGGSRRRRSGGSVMGEATAPAWRTSLQASVVRLGTVGTELVGRLWGDGQALVGGGNPRDVASRLAASALEASAEAGRQAEALLRRLAGQPSRLLAGLEVDAGRLTGTLTSRFGMASRDELTDLRRRL